jgi:hypothetical protein
MPQERTEAFGNVIEHPSPTDVDKTAWYRLLLAQTFNESLDARNVVRISDL